MNEDIFSGGTYHDDDGTELNPDLYPKPSLHLSCDLNESDDPEDEVLCNLNRLDQRNEKEFLCYQYKEK
jgi:hypothetical protein